MLFGDVLCAAHDAELETNPLAPESATKRAGWLPTNRNKVGKRIKLENVEAA
jgi:hypothetical protein